MKNCVLCGDEFVPVSSRQTRCSKEHQLDCAYCGTPFSYARGKRFCSLSCAGKYQSDNSQLKVISCIECGAEFESKRSTGFCSNPHVRVCVVCEKGFYKNLPSKVNTCSKECSIEKRKQTNRTKYGTDNAARTPEVKSKISNYHKNKSDEERAASVLKAKATSIAKYGVPHPLQSNDVKTAMTATVREKYKVDNVAQAEEVKKVTIQTNLIRYGTEHSFQSEDVKSAIRATNLSKYGVEHPLQSEAVRAKAVQTIKNKYGVDNVSQSGEVKDRIRQTNLDRYGTECSLQDESVKNKIRETLRTRYGVENAALIPGVLDKIRETTLKRYGVENVMQHEPTKAKFAETYLESHGVSNPAERSVSHYESYKDLEEYLLGNPQTINELSEYFNVTPASIRRRIRKKQLDDSVVGRYARSVKEARFYHQVKQTGAVVIRNDRTILSGKELDFYFPEHNLAVEISPTLTHNSKTGWGGTAGKARDYHKEKFLLCAQQGIELITVFDWHPWDSVMSLISHKLQSSARIAARKCIVEYNEQVSAEVRRLLAEWHVLGAPKNWRKNNTVTTLRYEGEIVGIALWSPRTQTEAELKRMVFKPGTAVMGGASKLLRNYVKNNPDLTKIVTFSDCDLGGGSVYGKIGFTQAVESRPGLNYHHPKLNKHIKHLSLVKQGSDRLLKGFPGYVPVGKGEGLPSNREIVESYGFLPVYDCGYRKWEMEL